VALIMNRRAGEEIRLLIDENSSAEELAELIRQGSTINISRIDKHSVRLIVEAPKSVSIKRGELQTA